MRNDQFSAIENVVTDQTIDEEDHLLFEFFTFRFELRECFRKPMSDPHIPAAKLAHQFHIVVPGYAEGRAALDHRHYKTEDGRRIRAAVHKVAQEYCLSAFGMPRRRMRIGVRDSVPERS